MKSAVPVDGESLALTAAALFAVDPVGLGGVVLRSAAGPSRDHWLAALRRLLPHEAPWRRVPAHVDDDRLLGGLDLTATLRAGRPLGQRGLLAEADGGIVLLAMAERLSASTAAHTAAVLDGQELAVERHGISARQPCRIGVVALDEGLDDDEGLASGLRERLAFRVVLGVRRDTATASLDSAEWTRGDVQDARALLADVVLGDEIAEGLCAAALALGIATMRAPILACRAARAAAALAGRSEVEAKDAALAAALVLAYRATRLPAAEAEAEAETESPSADAADDNPTDETADPPPSAESATAPPEQPDPAAGKGAEPEPDDADASAPPGGDLDDMVLQAALAAIPSGLLAALQMGKLRGAAPSNGSRAGAIRNGLTRGRPIGTRRGDLRGGARLSLIDTLRTAAPWQALRRREEEGSKPADGAGARIKVRREDFQLWRFQQRSETTTVFVVDASGSSALNRLAEAKGAVELLLADCYVRRDSVAVIAFRGRQAELLLPPTRSLARAKRSLAGLPGGGGTPLAAGLDSALGLSLAIRRRGATAVVVLLTDGRANVARDGSPGRARAGDDAGMAARQLRAAHVPALLIDTSPQPQETASRLAADMGARYVPLPYAGAASLSQVVRAAVLADRP